MLFEAQLSRKPNLYPWTKDFIDAIWKSFWTPNEFNFRSDYSQFKTELSEEQRGVVVRALSAIGQIEIAVKTFWAQLGRNLPHPSISDLGFVMAQNEVIHNMAYEKLLDVLGLEDAFERSLETEVFKNRVNYLRKYLDRVYEDDRKQYVYAIILFTLFVEYVSLFSQFVVILHFNRKYGWLKDTAQQVEYTRLEEQLHAHVGVTIINTLRQEYPELFDEGLADRVREECLVAFEAESRIIDWILGDYSEDDLNPHILKNYIAGRLNDALEMIGYEPCLKVDHQAVKAVHWMEEGVQSTSHTDFFHKRPVDYGKHIEISLEDLV